MYLTEGPVLSDEISRLINEAGSNMKSGGHSMFLGRVRADETDGTRVRAIEYSAYDEMVNTEAAKIKEILFSEFPDVMSVAIVHSRGVVNAGEVSLVVLVSAGHRTEAINGCSRAVELIKERLPVWKKEILEDDSARWKQNY